jgi:hypothetical protein
MGTYASTDGSKLKLAKIKLFQLHRNETKQEHPQSGHRFPSHTSISKS